MSDDKKEESYENGSQLGYPDAKIVDHKSEKRKILKSIILISFSFLLVFTAFQGLSRLQSSLHRDEGMGVINLSILYGALVLSCLLLPKLIISVIGHKWTIPLSFIGYILWMAANGYAVWGTMVTTSILVGLCAAPLWTAQCSYFTKIAGRYAQLSGETEQAVIGRFFGIFFMFFQLSGITGSLITAFVLQASQNDSLPADAIAELCGIRDCPDNNQSYNANFDEPSSAKVWTMLGIFIALAVVAVAIAMFLVDRLPKDLREDRSKAKQEVKSSLINTIRHLRVPEQCILIPLTMYSGFEQAFYGAEWTGSFVSCSIGIWKVGLVTLPFGVVNTLASFTSGHVIKYTGRLPIFTFGCGPAVGRRRGVCNDSHVSMLNMPDMPNTFALLSYHTGGHVFGLCVDLCIQLTLILWPLNVDNEYVFYIISGLWGLTDGIWQTQINALYGSIFTANSEAAFANYRMWESIGFIIAFACSSFLCTSVKVYILLSVLLLGMLGYYVVEWRCREHTSLDITSKKHKAAEAVVATNHTLSSTTGHFKGDFTNL